MNAEELFRTNLPLVDRVTARVCRRAGLSGADAEDFASVVKLALIENDYAILAGYQGTAPLGAFLAVVVQRLLTRERLRVWGRWHPSAEAERLGPAAALLEKLVVRDRRPLEEAIPLVRAVDPSLDRESVRALAGRLPPRIGRPRLVPLPEDADRFSASEGAEQRAQQHEARRISERTAQVVRTTIDSLVLQDRMLLRFHFGAELSIAETARLMGVPQRPLYRRVEALLRQLRKALEGEGLDAGAIADVIAAGASEEIDFGLGGKNAPGHHTPGLEERE